VPRLRSERAEPAAEGSLVVDLVVDVVVAGSRVGEVVGLLGPAARRPQPLGDVVGDGQQAALHPGDRRGRR
jgi:hypothetical protein